MKSTDQEPKWAFFVIMTILALSLCAIVYFPGKKKNVNQESHFALNLTYKWYYVSRNKMFIFPR